MLVGSHFIEIINKFSGSWLWGVVEKVCAPLFNSSPDWELLSSYNITALIVLLLFFKSSLWLESSRHTAEWTPSIFRYFLKIIYASLLLARYNRIKLNLCFTNARGYVQALRRCYGHAYAESRIIITITPYSNTTYYRHKFLRRVLITEKIVGPK